MHMSLSIVHRFAIAVSHLLLPMSKERIAIYMLLSIVYQAAVSIHMLVSIVSMILSMIF